MPWVTQAVLFSGARRFAAIVAANCTVWTSPDTFEVTS